MNSNYLKTIRILYFALAMGIVFFLLVTLLLNRVNGPFAQDDISTAERTPFLIVLIVLTGGIFMVYRTIYPKKLAAIQSMTSLDNKLAAWRELVILQGALIEAPAFFGLVLFLLFGMYALLLWPLTCLMLFWLTQPTREKLIVDTALTPVEIDKFDAMQ